MSTDDKMLTLMAANATDFADYWVCHNYCLEVRLPQDNRN